MTKNPKCEICKCQFGPTDTVFEDNWAKKMYCAQCFEENIAEFDKEKPPAMDS
jgi:hypothetical protein